MIAGYVAAYHVAVVVIVGVGVVHDMDLLGVLLTQVRTAFWDNIVRNVQSSERI